MPRKSLLTLILGLLALATVGVSRAQAQATNTIIDWNQQWSYLLTNAFPTGWSASNFNASAWEQGPGAFTFPPEEALPPGITGATTLATNFNTTFVTSFYFRTTFTLNTNPASLTFSGSAVVDDGAVIYVNGREVTRIRMPTGTIGPNTLASAGGEVSPSRIDAFTVNSTNFVEGVNVIAAEVHQDSGTSSDVVFGLRLTAVAQAPPVITQQPQSQEVNPGQRATFTVTATGTTPLVYRWYSNDVLIVTQSTANHITPIFNDVSANGSVYYVTVSNRLGLVRSANATLTVVQDVVGPHLISVFDTPNSTNRLTLIWNEPVLAATRDNRTNYALFLFGGTEPIALATNSQGGTATSIVLILNTNLDRSLDYLLCAYNIADARTNVTAEDCIGVGFTVTVPMFGFGEQWRFSDWNRAPTNFPAGVDWKQVNFNDDPFANRDWKLDQAGPFRDEQNPQAGQLCVQNPPTALNINNSAYYFRRRFTRSGTFPTNSSLVLRYNVDDGAVFYLNGAEIARVNMPAGTPAHGTFATACIESTCATLTITNGANLLRTGNNANVMAVELHNCNEGGAGVDATFDMELNVSYQDAPTVPRLTVSRPTPTTLRVNWPTTAVGFTLESAPEITGPWANAVPAPVQSGGQWQYQVPIDTQQPMRFFRLRNP